MEILGIQLWDFNVKLKEIKSVLNGSHVFVFGEKSVRLSYRSEIRGRGKDMPDGTPILITYCISYLKQLKLIKKENKQQSWLWIWRILIWTVLSLIIWKMWALAEFRESEEVNFSEQMSQIILVKSLNLEYQVEPVVAKETKIGLNGQ